jgi:tRNA1(Val) A37 N6-methylase TrmN6
VSGRDATGPEALLGGRVLLDQGGAGLRATIDPVLLAAAVPAKAGEAVLEAGTGVGTASLCLLARVPGARAVGVESDAAQAMRAAENAALNGWSERFAAIAGDVTDPATARAAAGHGPFAHAMANPPWFSGGSKPIEPARRLAKHGGGRDLARWIAFLARRVGPRGSVTLILPTALLPEALAGLEAARIGSPAVLPLWPHAGEAAKRVILSGRKGGRSPCRVLAGLVLHRQDGGFTAAAEAVLRDGDRLPLG